MMLHVVIVQITQLDSDADANNVDDTGNHDGAEDCVMIIMLIV